MSLTILKKDANTLSFKLMTSRLTLLEAVHSAIKAVKSGSVNVKYKPAKFLILEGWLNTK